MKVRIASLVLAFFMICGCAAPALAAGGTLKTGVAYVTASALRLRSMPSTGSQTLAYGYRDEAVVVLGKVGAWYQVSYNLQTGYMHSDYLRFLAKENIELGYGRVNGSSVNVRSGPGTGNAIVGRANLGDSAYIIGINDQWLRVIHGDSLGYIRSDYVDLTEIPYENRASSKEPIFYIDGKSTGTIPSAQALKGKTDGLARQEIVNTAKQYIGVPYVWGGTSPKGFDCSGFVQYVFAKHGVSLPRTSSQQWGVGSPVSRDALRAGDLVFFNTNGQGVSHVGIYIGNGQFIHASSSRGIMISELSNSYWSPRYVGAKQVL